MGVVLLFSNGCKKDNTNNPSNTVTDADGNIYHTVQIGSQVWMLENLKTTHYNDGSGTKFLNPVNTAWGGTTTAAYCWFSNDSSYKNTAYGALYNWYAVNSGKLCPAGWKVPSDQDWTTLFNSLGGDSTLVGGMLKEAGTAHWLTSNTATDNNSSGFTALPAGNHYTNGVFYLMGKYGWYWSSTESSPENAWHIYMQYTTSNIYRKAASKKIGFSVRCIKK